MAPGLGIPCSILLSYGDTRGQTSAPAAPGKGLPP